MAGFFSNQVVFINGTPAFANSAYFALNHANNEYSGSTQCI